MILGNPCSIGNLREFLSYVYANKTGVTVSPVIKGLAGIAGCTHCGKMGHSEECWKKHPKNMRCQTKCCSSRATCLHWAFSPQSSFVTRTLLDRPTTVPTSTVCRACTSISSSWHSGWAVKERPCNEATLRRESPVKAGCTRTATQRATMTHLVNPESAGNVVKWVM